MLKEKILKINDFIGGGLVRKFVIWIVFIIMLLGVMTTIFVQVSLNKTLTEELHERGQVISRNMATSIVESILIEDTIYVHRLVENTKKIEKDVKYIYITDARGKVLAHTFEGGFPVELLTVQKYLENSSHLLDTGDGIVIDFTAPILDGRAGFVHIGMDETSMHEKIKQTSSAIITITLLVGTLGVLMAYIAGNYLTRPIRSLVKGTEEIGRGNLGYQIKTDSTDEINILSNAFNKMSYNLNTGINELRESEERYRRFVDSISDAVILIDSQKKILSWNSGAQKIFGYCLEEVAGSKINILFYSMNEADNLEIPDGENVFKRKDGSNFPGLISNKPLQDSRNAGNVLVIKDIKEQKEIANLEKLLMRSEKLFTLGKLAAGVAHEINNPLTAISLHTQIMLRKTWDEKTDSRLKIINKETNRAAGIVKRLLEFAHQSEPKIGSVDINSEIDIVLNVLEPQLNSTKITTDLMPLPLIMADGEQIQQVIMNMLTNSIQSITTDGEIIIKTAAKNDHIEISIIDNGCGISQDNIGRVFDPFFTTKKSGEGTGLGLSICYGVIKKHNGLIDVKSRVGTGTTFTIRLPI
ncbi:MAG: two component system histidine kinase [Candidatus Methanoperedens nitroreducens]|uniref:histidine kinase n=1 Tax=Candidatus Methanoperedens nitratireducens TaxID=1392998 RepID=A0A0P8AGR4_9EURY|nr:ATP-binding protein [Candidatus Methanoperedens sp. BLZ2]KAB2948469.1 MAG: PAS domain S-box protein [Candidatus Methanoperedens sp.]KPQ43591.1 MAG: two component system histidine kinase [Candidatus Methanoperedens sp. BLZ1]MBZ0174431.1 PAS domain S-box protein [Candidatus Methanoperedens nitroreducens]MCX9078451.1 ATP-binding protein [Candidatus Methanoperedens sp.]